MTEATSGRLARADETWNNLSRLAGRISNAALSAAGPILVLVVAFSGWSLSYRKLHGYGVLRLGETDGFAWLVPLTFSLAPLGLSLVILQAKRKARSAWLWRIGLWTFAAIESGINYISTPAAFYAREIAAALPLSAVILFEGLMWLTHRRALERMYGEKVIPRLAFWCWLLDPKRTFQAFKTKRLMPLAAAEEALGLHLPQALNSVSTVPVTLEPAPGEVDVPNPSPVLTKAERHDKVREILTSNPHITAEALGRELSVSKATAARDLQAVRILGELTKEGE